MNGLDPGAIDFRQIGRSIEAEANDGGLEGRGFETNVGEAEIDDEELHQRRRAAKDLQIGNRRIAQRPPPRKAHECYEKAEYKGEDQRAKGNCYRFRPTAEQRRQEIPALGVENLQEAHAGRHRSWMCFRNSRVRDSLGLNSTSRGLPCSTILPSFMKTTRSDTSPAN